MLAEVEWNAFQSLAYHKINMDIGFRLSQYLHISRTNGGAGGGGVGDGIGREAPVDTTDMVRRRPLTTLKILILP
jgi:hypothetical protein